MRQLTYDVRTAKVIAGFTGLIVLDDVKRTLEHYEYSAVGRFTNAVAPELDAGPTTG
jgi:hypothetical protein